MTCESANDDQRLQEIVKSTLEAVVPERAEELLRHWNEYPIQFQIVDDMHETGPVVLDAGSFVHIRFNHRVMRLFWLASFMLWEGYEAYSFYAKTGETDTRRFAELYECFVATKSAQDVDAVPWPDGIPPAGELVEHRPGNPERVAGELAIVAVCWAILHEIQHLIHQQDGTAADREDVESCRAEEISCDLFATEYLLADLRKYADASGQDFELLKMKRQAGIYGALFAMTLIAEEAWGESDSHPALQVRLERVVATIDGLGFNRIAGGIAASAFITLKLRFPDAPDPLETQGFSTAFNYDLSPSG